jgi:hypothetical protein
VRRSRPRNADLSPRGLERLVLARHLDMIRAWVAPGREEPDQQEGAGLRRVAGVSTG